MRPRDASRTCGCACAPRREFRVAKSLKIEIRIKRVFIMFSFFCARPMRRARVSHTPRVSPSRRNTKSKYEKGKTKLETRKSKDETKLSKRVSENLYSTSARLQKKNRVCVCVCGRSRPNRPTWTRRATCPAALPCEPVTSDF